MTSQVPSVPPKMHGGTSHQSHFFDGLSSLRKPQAPASEPVRRATVLVAFAVTALVKSSSAGNVYSVPPPASEFCAPAANADNTRIE